MIEYSYVTQFLSHRRHKPLTREEEAEHLRRAQAGDEAAVRVLVERNMKFVAQVAQRYQGRGLSPGELLSEGAIGLAMAVQRFDMASDWKFISYAVWWIRQRMVAALGCQVRTVELPPRFLELSRKIERARRAIEGKKLRPAYPSEIAEALGMPLARFSEILGLMTPNSSIDSPRPAFPDEEGGTLADILPSDDDPSEAATAGMAERHHEKLLAEFNDLDRDILTRRLGLNGDEPEDLEEIGQRHGICRERVRQREKAALEKLRKRYKTLEAGIAR